MLSQDAGSSADGDGWQRQPSNPMEMSSLSLISSGSAAHQAKSSRRKFQSDVRLRWPAQTVQPALSCVGPCAQHANARLLQQSALPAPPQMELLANRIERLRAEERKAKQKVLETKIRGQEIISLQKRNQELQAAKEMQKRAEMQQRVQETHRQQLKRAEHRAALKSTFEGMHVSKREEVRTERRIKSENAEMLRQAREYDLKRARHARTVIRAHQHVVKERFEKQRQAHQEFLAQDFVNMIALEDRRREEVEREIARMEVEEHQHIDRLIALQEEQKAAYDALEQALAS
jgi:hypothetical protein